MKRVPKAVAKPARKRFYNSPTLDHKYTESQVEFLTAMRKFKESGHPFPTWCQVLDVLKSLGYRKISNPSAGQ